MLLSPVGAMAQIPTQCLEIESILVDACAPAVLCPGSSEGMNEMVRFRTGPVAIALSELEADWPNNNWLGLVQNAGTAALTASLNDSIVACGHLVEPPGGIIPPGSTVLMVTSTQMCLAANSFANLADTLQIIFQAPGNSAGHFANHNNGSTVSATPTGASDLRTLVLTYLPTGCADTAMYDRSLLQNIYGTYGGVSSENDGATATFTWPGPPQVGYQNLGCTAPVVANDVVINVISGSLCGGSGQVSLEAVATGLFSGGSWSGGTGSFSNPFSLSTDYTAGAGDLGDVTLFFSGTFSCGDPVIAPVVLPAGQEPVVGIVADGPTALCPGESVLLTATGADTYVWSTSETTGSISVSQAGTISVTGTNACGSADAQVAITVGTLPDVTIVANGPTALCPGQSVTLTASGADSYLWSTSETSAAIIVAQAGTVTVTGTNTCGTASAEIEVTEGAPPAVSISGPLTICQGSETTLTATGADSYIWNTQETSESITVSSAGTYSVTGTNGCGTGDASAEVIEVDLNASFNADVLQGETPLTVVFSNTSTPQNGAFSWIFGDGGTSSSISPIHTFIEPGTFLVVLTVTDQGCTSTSTTTILATSTSGIPSTVSVPNVFTPNGDGINDQLQMLTINIASVTMRIFNRYGQEIALLERPRQMWDGRTFAGEVASDGTYFYIVEALGIDGVEHDLTGHITLLR